MAMCYVLIFFIIIKRFFRVFSCSAMAMFYIHINGNYNQSYLISYNIENKEGRSRKTISESFYTYLIQEVSKD